MREGTTDMEHRGLGLVKKPGELSKLAQSGDAQRLVQLLQQGEACKMQPKRQQQEILRN